MKKAKAPFHTGIVVLVVLVGLALAWIASPGFRQNVRAIAAMQ